MKIQEKERIREAVRNRYAQVATGHPDGQDKTQKVSGGCCGSTAPQSSAPGSGCGCGASDRTEGLAPLLGYSAQDQAGAPEGADMGLGCGNPVALASLKPGETVVDLGSGGGFDCFLAGARVGAGGKVIGIDMTAEMVAKARRNAMKADAANVEFRLGEIEHLPVADNCADIIISNCVVNLSVDKNQVYAEAFRVLKPGGRLFISDIVATAPLPPEIQADLELVSACVGGAATLDDTRAMLERAGFEGIRIDENEKSRGAIEACMPGSDAAGLVISAYIQAHKPKA